MQLEELLSRIPTSSGMNAHPLLSSAGQDVEYVLAAMPEFVAPTLSLREDAPSIDANPKVIVVSAPGAVGKTTLAKRIANSRNGLYWDLAKSSPVGGDSLGGMLLRVFGSAGIAAVDKGMKDGTFTLVIDSLDEARVKVSEAAFHAFLRGIADAARQSAAGTVMLFARTQHADTAWLILNDCDVSTSLLTIDMFERRAAEQYIESRLSTDEKSRRAMESYRESFEEARDLIFRQLEDAASVGGSQRQEALNFLGYAPVLDAIAVLLRTELNFSSLCSDLRTATTSEPRNILNRIIEEILRRERNGKVLPQIRDVLAREAEESGWSGWDDLYSDREQCLRLLRLLAGLNPAVESAGVLPSALPLQLAARYDEQVEPFLKEHPLLANGNRPANVVFQAYLYAYALTRDDGAVRAEIEGLLSAREYKPTSLFKDFYLAMTKRNEDDLPVVLASHLGYLYDAALAGETGNTIIWLNIEGDDPEDYNENDGGNDESPSVVGEFVEYSTKTDDYEASSKPIEFALEVSRGMALRFTRYLRNTTITVPCCVELGDGGEFEVGPNVSIRCSSLRLMCDSLVVGGRSLHPDRYADELGRDGSVLLEALSCESTLSKRPIVHSTLSVDWPDASRFPWSEYRRKALRDSSLSDDPRLHQVFRRFRRIVLALRSHSKGSLARCRDKIEHRRVVKGEMGKALLKKLNVDGILRLDREFYHWVPDVAASKVGVTWLDLKNGFVDDAGRLLISYLKDFVEQHADLF